VNRFFLAFLWFFKILFGTGKAELEELQRKAALPAPKPEPVKPVKPAEPAKPVKPAEPARVVPAEPPKPAARVEDGALRMLAVLQGEGRLVDFLLEDIAAYPDDQIGAAVRNIHADCRRALEGTVKIAPVMAGDEGSFVQVARGFDPSAVRVVGNVKGEPPYSGSLRHHGWKVTEVKLPGVPAGQDLSVVAPAEVEVA
jgi:hypothetical protein